MSIGIGIGNSIPGNSTGPSANDDFFLLLEDNAFLLLENGGNISLEMVSGR